MLAPATASARRGTFLDDLGQIVYAAHRGAGGNLARDTALSAVDYLIGMGMPPGNYMTDGGDYWITSDLQLAIVHDSTADRTLNGTGTIASKTLADVKALEFRDVPLARGTVSVDGVEHPGGNGDWLDVLRKYGLFGTPELKSTSNAAVDVFLGEVQARGMERNVLISCFTPGPLSRFNTASPATPTLLLHSASTVRDAATIATAINGAPPTVVGYDMTDTTNFTDAWITSVVAAGMTRFAPFTNTGRRVEADAEIARLLGLGATQVILYSDDPFYVMRHPAADGYAADRFDTRWTEHGYVPSDKDIELSVPLPYIDRDSGKLRLWATNRQQCCLAGANTHQTREIEAVEVDITFDALDSTTTRWAYVCIAPDDRNHYEVPGSDANSRGAGYVFALRQNGGQFPFRRDGSGGSTVGTNVGVEASSTTITAGSTVRLRVEKLGDGRLKMTRLDTGVSVTTTNPETTYSWTSMHFGKSGSGGQRVSFSNLAVTFAD